MKLIALATAATCTLVSLSAFAVPRNITGTLKYDDYKHDDPNVFSGVNYVRNHPVTVSVVGGATLGTVDTDANGFYALYGVEVPASGTLRVSFGSQNYAAEIMGGTAWSADMAIPSGTGPITFSPPSFIKTNNGKKLNALNALARARAYVDARRDDVDEIPLAANPNHVKLHYPTAGGPMDYAHYCTAANSNCSGANVIELPDANAWQDGVITHEYGHHLQYYVSGPPMAMGNLTDPCSAYSHIQAWHEGFPQYLAGAVLGGTLNNYAWYGVGYTFHMDWMLCPFSNPPAGTTTYEYVWLTLWDVHDSTSTGDDMVNGPYNYPPAGTPKDAIIKVFDKELDVGAIPDIVQFHDAMIARNFYPGFHADLDYTYGAHKIVGGGKVHSLPDYTATSISFSPSSFTPGSWSTLNMTLQNLTGYNYAAETIYVRVYVGTTQLDLFTVNSSFVTLPVSRSIFFPASLGYGTKTVSIKVDNGQYGVGRFTEETEANNLVTKTVALNTYCGDGVCVQSEDCDTCEPDCGECDPWEPPPNCFVAGTPITMADGTTKPIELIQAGDVVLSFDEATGELAPGTVSWTVEHPVSERIVVVNDTLVTTAEHPFYVGGRWVRADRLSIGDTLMRATSDGAAPMTTQGEVRSLEGRPDRPATYNFEVARHHTYFAGGYLVHNIKPSEP